MLQLLLALLTNATSEEWPQYAGPNGDRTSAETFVRPAWSGTAPTAWKVATSGGFSSFAVADGRAITLVGRGGLEVCVALDAESGRELWSSQFSGEEYDGGAGAGADGNKGGDGPRTTPSIVGGRVFVLDSQMVLACLDAETGRDVWRKDLQAEHGARTIRWQNSASPLVEDGRVFVVGGGRGQSILAFDAESGEVVWSFGDEAMTHATPIAATIDGVRQVIFLVQFGLISVVPESGRVLWRQKCDYKISTGASPVVHDGIVYVSAGYGVGATAFTVALESDTFRTELLWRKRNRLINHWSTPVCKDGYLYGMYSFKDYGDGPLKCIELATGDEMWARDGFGPGNCILIGEELIALSDAGEVVVVEATPDAYRESARAAVLDGKCWSMPSFADGSLFLRSTREGARLDLSSGP